jgi:hypothetical protein
MNDPKGLLSLYNATHLLVHGEKTLEEAMDFSRHHLKLMSGSLKFPLDKQVQRALCIPLPRTNKRVEMMHYILEYEQEDHTLILLELAKLDFNLQQHVHLKELKAITRYVVFPSQHDETKKGIIVHRFIYSCIPSISL